DLDRDQAIEHRISRFEYDSHAAATKEFNHFIRSQPADCPGLIGTRRVKEFEPSAIALAVFVVFLRMLAWPGSGRSRWHRTRTGLTAEQDRVAPVLTRSRQPFQLPAARGARLQVAR